MKSITLGDVEVTQILEQPNARLPRTFAFPDTNLETWRANEAWLAPDFWDPASDELVANFQTWMVRSKGKVVLIDTGAGNGKERPYLPDLAHLNTPFLDNLAAAGVHPEDVDVVVCTHLHSDHVGWNTRLVDRTWVPTFPNAQYLFAQADFDYWNPDNGHTTRSGRSMQNVFEDSIAPIHHAGQATLWDGHYDVDANLRLEPAPGHTPGSTVMHLRSGSDRAVFVGDLLHTPMQLLDPDRCMCFDEDEPRARATRRRVLAEIADHNALMLPAHFPTTGALEIARNGENFAIKQWAGEESSIGCPIE